MKDTCSAGHQELPRELSEMDRVTLAPRFWKESDPGFARLQSANIYVYNFQTHFVLQRVFAFARGLGV